MELSIVIFLYSRTVTTVSKIRFHCRPVGFVAYISFMHWRDNGLFYINRNIGVRLFKTVQILGWWTDKEYFMNGNLCILGYIADIQNYGSESMHSCYRNVDYEEVRTCHWTEVSIKINTLNMITSIWTVLCNKFSWLITVALLNIWINEWMEDLCSIREIFDCYGIRKKAEIFVLLILHK